MSEALEYEEIAAFSHAGQGGNPAGVVIATVFPSDADMQALAARLGHPETVFAVPQDDGYRVRYFSPETEVPFCGHATIALGAALARRSGPGRHRLVLNHAVISVEGRREGDRYGAVLQSPPTRSSDIDPSLLADVLDLFGLDTGALDPALSPARIHGGSDHVLLGLARREDLAAMHYDLDAGRTLMRAAGLVTIMLVWQAPDGVFHVRNAFASGGVAEDPATGAAAAAFAGHLRDRGRPAGTIRILQGEDMDMPSRIEVAFTAQKGAGVAVSGEARWLHD